MTADDAAKEGMTHCLAMRSRAVARALTRSFDDALRPFGVTVSQYTLLIAIRMTASPSITALAETLEIERSGLSRNMKLLQSAGLISMDDGGGARARALELTTAGRALIEKALPAWRRAQADAAARLGVAGEAELHRAFRALKGERWPHYSRSQ